MIEITHRYDSSVLFSAKVGSLKLAVEAAVKNKTYLGGAYLGGADLEGAYLEGAYLEGAYLEGAKIEATTVLDTGETFAQYVAEVVPALLTAGGQTLAEVAEAWDCHTWDNCPMAVAFSVHKVEDVPLLYRPRAEQFVLLFDAGLLPKPGVERAA